MNNNSIGCGGLICVLVLIAVVWKAILYIGLPLAFAGGGIAYYLIKGEDEARRNYGWIVAGASLLLGLASIAGNLTSDDGLLSAEQSDEPSNDGDVIPKRFQGTWTSGGCHSFDNRYEIIRIDGSDIRFGSGGTYSVNAVLSESSGSITFEGTSIAVSSSSWEAAYMEERATLYLSDGGNRLAINDRASSFRRCSR